MKTQYKHLLQRTYLVLVFGFMYLPIAVLIAYSFNENKSRAVFTGFSLKWYASLFHNEMILSALGLSLVLAFVSAIIATVLGTLATIGINSMSRKAQLIINNISYVPVVNPEIITGVSLMLLFVIGWLWIPTTLLAAYGADIRSQIREFSWALNQWTGLKQPYIGFFSFVPMDIYPMHLLKATLAGDIEKMENLGIYEVVEEDFALCEFVDPSKIEMQQIIRDGINLMIKEA